MFEYIVKVKVLVGHRTDAIGCPMISSLVLISETYRVLNESRGFIHFKQVLDIENT